MTAEPAPPTLLLINPNTSTSVTHLLERAALAAAATLPQPVRVQAVTAGFGPRYITGEVGAAVAGHAALEAYARHAQQHGAPSAVLLACFGDPGLFALRALCPCPVLGLAEASMRAAAAHGPFVVLTGGAAWVPMLQRLAQALPLPAPMLGVHALPRSGGEMAAQPEAAVGWLAAAGAEALARWPQARTLLLGGAGLAGLAAPLAGRLAVPVLDNVDLALQKALQAALQAALQSAHMHKPGASDAPPAPPEAGPWCGLGPALAACLPAGGTGLAQPGASTPP